MSDPLEDARKAHVAAAAAKDVRDGAIREAWRRGLSIRAIAEHVGLSSARVHQIVAAQAR